MFSKKNKPKKTTRIDTLIAEKTQIEGNIHFSGGLKIDGHIIGNVITPDDSSSAVTVSEQGSINGEIQAAYLTINGNVTGNLLAYEHIELAAKARIQGNVYYRTILMSVGAQVNGQLIHVDEEQTLSLDISHDTNIDSPNLNLEQNTNLD